MNFTSSQSLYPLYRILVLLTTPLLALTKKAYVLNNEAIDYLLLRLLIRLLVLLLYWGT